MRAIALFGFCKSDGDQGPLGVDAGQYLAIRRLPTSLHAGKRPNTL